jgi:hypothetical protein
VADVGDVRHPHLVRPIGRKIALQRLSATGWECFESVVASILAPDDRAQAQLSFILLATIFTDWKTHVVEFIT